MLMAVGTEDGYRGFSKYYSLYFVHFFPFLFLSLLDFLLFPPCVF